MKIPIPLHGETAAHRRCRLAALVLLVLSVVPVTAQTYAVSGTAELQDTTDYSGITVAIYRGPVQDTVQTDSYGDYYFTGLTFGRYYFRFTKEGYVPCELSGVEISDDMFLTTVTLDTIPDTTQVRGTAYLENAAGHEGIAVKVTAGSDAYYDTTDADGAYALPLLAGTDVVVFFAYEGFSADTLDTFTVDGATFTIDTVTLDSAYLISGTACYCNESSHEDIVVTAYTSDSSFFASTTTDDDGAYAITLPDSGRYKVLYTASGYQPVRNTEYVNSCRMVLDTVLLDSAQSGTTYYGGTLDRDTRWTGGSEPHIREDFTVPAGVTLTIEAGTHVYVAPSDSNVEGTDIYRVEFRVLGALHCLGTRSNPVTFRSEASSPAAGDWRGIEILDGADTCRIRNTTVKHGFWGVCADNGSALLLDSCRITANTNGVNVTATPVLMNGTLVISNTSAAGNFTDCGFAVSDCRFMNNGGNGPGFYGGRGAVFNSLVYSNQGTRGITVADSVEVVLCNNTVVNNGYYGIDASGARAVIVNNVINGHTSYGINNSSQAYGAGIEITYNCLWSNGSIFRNCPDSLLHDGSGTVNANGDTVDGRYNLYYSPGLSTVYEDLYLASSSKCLGAGTSRYYSVQLDDTVKVYNTGNGLPHIGRDADMSAILPAYADTGTADTVVTDTTVTDTTVTDTTTDDTTTTDTTTAIDVPKIGQKLGPFTLTELAAKLSSTARVYDLSGKSWGRIEDIPAGMLPTGVYLVTVLRENKKPRTIGVMLRH